MCGEGFFFFFFFHTESLKAFRECSPDNVQFLKQTFREGGEGGGQTVIALLSALS